jgi:hypothetical protein
MQSTQEPDPIKSGIKRFASVLCGRLSMSEIAGYSRAAQSGFPYCDQGKKGYKKLMSRRQFVKTSVAAAAAAGCLVGRMARYVI